MGKISPLPLTKIIPARWKSRKLLGVLFFLAFSFFLFSFPGWSAMSFTFSGAPLAVERDEVFGVQVSLVSAPPNRTYFLRAAFFQEGTNQYFGYTLNNQGNWHKEVGEHDYFLKINSGEEGGWTGSLKAKVDLEAAGFQGPGEYLFKLGRYTEAGSLSWSDNQVGVTILLDPTPGPTPTITSTPIPYNGKGISLNEIMAWPIEGEEWVEIKNENDFEVSLVDWFLDDLVDGGSKPFKFSLKIPGGGLEVVYVGTRFNNSGDVVRLIGQGGQEINAYPYASAERGYSFARDENGNWHLTLDPTPGEENRIVGFPSPTLFPSPTWLPIPSPTTSPTETSFSHSVPIPTVLGLVDDYQLATESAGLTDLVCPLIEELEAGSLVLNDSYLGESQGERWFESNPKQKPTFNFFCLLGLGIMVSSFGFFLKDAGVLVEWKHGLGVKA